MRKNSYDIGMFRRTAIAVAIGVCLSSSAYAQTAEGSIFGSAKSKATVTLQSLETGTSRQVTTEANGTFSFSRLQPGRYRVTSDGVSREVEVTIGSGTQVALNEVATVTVTGSRQRSAIDVSTVESSTVFTAAQMQALPVTRSATAIALLAPGAVEGDVGLGEGSLPSIGGASVAENGYYINGFDVTNIRNFISYASLPFDAIGQQQIKTGGYGAEYGRSLGGVVAISTKRGTNEVKGGFSAYWAPKSLRASGRNVRDLEPTRPNNYTVFQKDDERGELSYNAYVGGPLIKDKLFAFALVENQRNEFNNFGNSSSVREISGRPNGMIKLDWVPNSNHRVEFTGIVNKSRVKYYDYDNATPYSTSNDGTARFSEEESGGTVSILRYTGYLTDSLTLSAQVGRVYHLEPLVTGARRAESDCPVVLDTDFSEIGCWAMPWPGPSILDNSLGNNQDVREAGRLDIEYNWGDHTIRAGIDAQSFKSLAAGSVSYNGAYWLYQISPTGTVNGVPNAVAPGGQYARRRYYQTTTGNYEVKNNAAYIEDTWKITKNVQLYGGLRAETFENLNGDGVAFVESDALLAPRLGASWNVRGDSSLKVYGTAGRYYIPVAANTNIRATGGEEFTHHYYAFTGRDPRTQAPIGLSAPIGLPQINGDGSLPDPRTVADTELKPMSQDEYIVGFQQALSKQWSYGLKYTHRKINNGMDDYCAHSGIANWAADNGYTDFDFHSLAPCMIVNPGEDLNVAIDLRDDGTYTPVTIPASYLGLARYERKYDALELTVDRPFDGKWGLSGSYTLAKSQGTAEGYVQSNLDQDDAGLTQDFDFGSFSHGAYGYLPNDRRHVLKAYGTYSLTENFRLGLNSVIASGRPTSCIGFVPSTVEDYLGPDGSTSGGSAAYNSASSYYCLGADGKSHLTQRGTAGRTPWTTRFDLSLAWVKNFGKNKLTLQADIFNLFNSQKTTEWDEVRDFSRASTSATEGRLNTNYQQPTGFQSPRSVRFTGRYEF